MILRSSPLASLVPLALCAVASASCGGESAAAAPPTTAVQAKSSPDVAAPKAPDHPDSDKVTWKKDATLAQCHNDVKTGADLVAGVTAMATACTGQTKMHQIGQTVQGSRKNLDPALTIPLQAQANHCYRVYGLSEDALKDLDIAVIDSAGKSAGEDGSDSPDAVVLEDGEICFKQADNVSVNVVAGDGNGKFAVEIWGD